MKLLYNRLIIYILLSALGFSQNPSPFRYSLKSTTDGETSFFEDGFNSNVVAEIKLMGDSLTWFGTGRGLSLYDGESAFTYQSTTDSIVDVLTNPSSVTSVLPSGGVSAIAATNDTLLVAFAGDDNNTPLGLGLAIASKAGSWYETEPTNIMSFDFLWDSLAVDTLNGIYFGFDSEYEIGTGYSGTFIVLSPLTEAVKTTISDSVKANTIIKITNSDLSKTLSFTVQSITEYSTAQVQLIIQPGSINYSSINDDGFLNGETIKLNITKATKAIAWQFLPQPVDSDLDVEVPFGEGYFWQLPVTVPQANVTYDASISGKYLYVASWAGGLRRYDLSVNLRKPQNIPMPMDWQSQLSTCQDSAYVDTLSKITGDPIPVLKNYYFQQFSPAHSN